MSAVAEALYELATQPLTQALCSKAQKLAESIEDREKRHRAYDFVQKFMWDRLPETKPATRTSKSTTKRASKSTSTKATKASKRPPTKASGRVSLIDDFGQAYGEYLQDPKPLNLSKAQAMYIRAVEGGETHRALYEWAQEIGDRVLMDTWIEERANYWQPKRS
jgi:inhibitor of KinA sporulation pathway (predicted exonuclease)